MSSAGSDEAAMPQSSDPGSGNPENRIPGGASQRRTSSGTVKEKRISSQRSTDSLGSSDNAGGVINNKLSNSSCNSGGGTAAAPPSQVDSFNPTLTAVTPALTCDNCHLSCQQQQQQQCSSSTSSGMGSSNSSVASTVLHSGASETKATATPLSTPYPPTLAAAASGSANAAIVTVKTNYKTSQRRPTPVAPRKKLHRSNSQSPPRHQARGESNQGQHHSKAVAAAFNCAESSSADLSRSQTLAIAEESPSALVSEHHQSAEAGTEVTAIFELGPPSSSTNNNGSRPPSSLESQEGGGGYYVTSQASEGSGEGECATRLSTTEYIATNENYLRSSDVGHWAHSATASVPIAPLRSHRQAGPAASVIPTPTGVGQARHLHGHHNLVHSASANAFTTSSGATPIPGARGDPNGMNHSASYVSLQQAKGDKRKKSPWYNALYPSYKSRSEDFKKIFTKLPEGERLIVEYSCALQKDILVHGRLYVSKNYLCFYSNIFRWETCVRLRWKDVASIAKEKTALVIPNAIEIATSKDTDEKYFFTSFLARDRAYLMLFKLWQNALLDQPASSAEIWKWIHSEYGDELGLTSEDESDYHPPFRSSFKPGGGGPGEVVRRRKGGSAGVGGRSDSPLAGKSEESKNSNRISSITEEESQAEGDECSGGRGGAAAETAEDDEMDHRQGNNTSYDQFPFPISLDGTRMDEGGDGSYDANGNMQSTSSRPPSPGGGGGFNADHNDPGRHLAVGNGTSDLSDVSSDIEGFAPPPPASQVRKRNVKGKVSTGVSSLSDVEMAAAIQAWRSSVEGREMIMGQTFPISVDELFTQLFTNSKFYIDFHTSRKSFDIVQSSWQQKPDSRDKFRELNFNISLTHPMGPKHSAVTETQTMRHSSRPGQIYLIDVDAINTGIPYADSFYVTQHWCLSRIAPEDPEFVQGAKDSSRIALISNIVYKKTVWGIVKTFIEKNAWAGMEDWNVNITRALLEECEAGLSPSANGMSAKKAKKKARSAGAGTHQQGQVGPGGKLRRGDPSGTVGGDGREVGVDDDDEDAAVDGLVGRKGAHLDNGNPLSSGSAAVGSGGQRRVGFSGTGGSGSGTGGGGSFNDILVKFMLILLASLFLANSLMFYKLWGLEERLLVTTPTSSKGGQHKSSDGKHHKPFMDPMLENILQFNSPEFQQQFAASADGAASGSRSGHQQHPSNPIDWMRLLHRQELIHQLELEKWHDLIGAATELLRQTEHSLQDLQKSIHPLALQKMRGLMFLQNEDWERILTLSPPSSSPSPPSHNNHHFPHHHNYKAPPDKPQPKHFHPDQTQPSDNIKPAAMSTSESTASDAKSSGPENLVTENQGSVSPPPEGYQQPILHQEH